jgi:hypothetical protein
MKLVSSELGGLWSSESEGWLFVHECYSGWITMNGLEMGEVVTVEWTLCGVYKGRRRSRIQFASESLTADCT